MRDFYNSDQYAEQHEKISFEIGTPALSDLYEVAQGKSRDAYVIGLFLMGLYDGKTYPFNLELLKQIKTSNLIHCISVIHLMFHSSKSLINLLKIKKSDFENLIVHITRLERRITNPQVIVIGNVNYTVDKTYSEGAKACINKIGSNPFKPFTNKNMQWQYGFDNEYNGHHNALGFYFGDS